MAKPVLGHDPFASLAQAPVAEAKPQAAKKAKAAKPTAAAKAAPPKPAAAPKKAEAPKKSAPKAKAAKTLKPKVVPQAPSLEETAAPLPKAPEPKPAFVAAQIVAPESSPLWSVCSKAAAAPAQGLTSLLGHLWVLTLSPQCLLPSASGALFALENASPAPALPLLAITARALAEESGRRVFILAPKPESLAMALAAKLMDPPCLSLEQARRALAQGDWVLAYGAGEAAALGRPQASLTLSGQKPLCKSLPGPLRASLETLALLPLWRPGRLLLHTKNAAYSSSEAGRGA